MNLYNIMIIIGTIFIFLFGSLLHFTYSLSKENKIIGLISAINESVFEHTKLLVFPTIIWWMLIYLIKKEELNLDLDKWMFSLIIALITSIIMVITIYSSYIKSFSKSGKGIVFIDILIFLFASFVGEALAMHFYQHFNPWDWYYSLSTVILIIVSYGILTYLPPNIPLFIDYSIKR